MVPLEERIPLKLLPFSVLKIEENCPKTCTSGTHSILFFTNDAWLEENKYKISLRKPEKITFHFDFEIGVNLVQKLSVVTETERRNHKPFLVVIFL